MPWRASLYLLELCETGFALDREYQPCFQILRIGTKDVFLSCCLFRNTPLKTSLVAQMVKRLPTMRDTWVRSLGREDPLEKEMATYSGTLVENPMDGGAWWATVHGVAKSWT